MTRAQLLSTITLLLALPLAATAAPSPWTLSNLGPQQAEPILDTGGDPLTGEFIIHLVVDPEGDGPDPVMTDPDDFIGQPGGDDLRVAEWITEAPLDGINPPGAFTIFAGFDLDYAVFTTNYYLRVFNADELTETVRFVNSRPFDLPATPVSAQTVARFDGVMPGYVGNTAPTATTAPANPSVVGGELLEFTVLIDDPDEVTVTLPTGSLPFGDEAVEIVPVAPGEVLVRVAVPPVGNAFDVDMPVLLSDGELSTTLQVPVSVSAADDRPAAFMPLLPADGATAWEGEPATWQPSVHPGGSPVTYTFLWSLDPEMTGADSAADLNEPGVLLYFADALNGREATGETGLLKRLEGDGVRNDGPAAQRQNRLRQPAGLRESASDQRKPRHAVTELTDRPLASNSLAPLERSAEREGGLRETPVYTEIPEGATFYWQVRAVAGDGSQRLSQLRSAVAERPDAPSTFALIAPGNGDALATTEPVFSWNAATDPDIGDTLRYDLRWSDDGGASWDTVAAIEGTSFDMAGEVYHLAGAGALRDWIRAAAREQALIAARAAGAGTGSGQDPPVLHDVSRTDDTADGLAVLSALKTPPAEATRAAKRTNRTAVRSVAADLEQRSAAQRGAPSAGRRSGTVPGDDPVTDDLPDNSSITWTVDAVDATGLRTAASDVWSFTVDAPSTPSPFLAIFPADSLWVRAPGQIELNWTAAVDPDPVPLTYDLLATTDPALADPAQFPVLESGLDEPSAVLPATEDDRTWRWAVRAISGDDTTWIDHAPLTLFVSREDLPEPFALLEPGDGAQVPTTDPQFAWREAVDSDLADSLSYTFFWSLDGWASSDSITGLVDTTVTFGQPVPDETVVHWAVRAVDTNSPGRWAEPGPQGRSFQVYIDDPPAPFALAAPDSGQALTGSYANLTWFGSEDPEQAGPLSYVVYLAETPDFANSDQYDAGADTSLSLEAWNLALGTHWWKVEAVDAGGMTTESSQSWSFVVTEAGVAGLGARGLPTEFGVARAYPNPFNPVLTVLVAVPEPGATVTVAMHDLLGRRVLRQDLQAPAPGYRPVTMDLTGHASGPYFIHLLANGQRFESRRVTYLK